MCVRVHACELTRGSVDLLRAAAAVVMVTGEQERKILDPLSQEAAVLDNTQTRKHTKPTDIET